MPYVPVGIKETKKKKKYDNRKFNLFAYFMDY